MASFKYNRQPSYGGFNVERLMRWRNSLVIWGAGAGIAVSLYMSSVPLFQKDVLRKVPAVSDYFVDSWSDDIDKTPDSDKPF